MPIADTPTVVAVASAAVPDLLAVALTAATETTRTGLAVRPAGEVGTRPAAAASADLAPTAGGRAPARPVPVAVESGGRIGWRERAQTRGARPRPMTGVTLPGGGGRPVVEPAPTRPAVSPQPAAAALPDGRAAWLQRALDRSSARSAVDSAPAVPMLSGRPAAELSASAAALELGGATA